MSEAEQQRSSDEGGPEPEPIRFFGTTWVHHDGGYGWRRAGLAIGSLLAAAAGAFVVRFAYQGFDTADVGAFVKILFVAAFAICTALAFRQTWDGFNRRPESRGDNRGLLLIGFIGSLFAYFVRCLREAPGERLRRTEYERAREAYERRRSTRTGNPAARSANSGRRKRR
ncbi:hypothetical protein [Streptomyces silvisoli]|uniref:EamA/RhaT family transporter n=1 Tax=Streptomyces silvisoli TaxID=3034235 RepID=A0ABT5ZSX1_9ACTN|nr:hypothetical protein [Streptomyces silvisoli]MDF3292133.1 hypothetical protein [Streptomyces silvisoli]